MARFDSRRSRSRSGHGDVEEEYFPRRDRDRSPGRSSRTVEVKGDSKRVIIESDRSRPMYDYSQGDSVDYDTRRSKSDIRDDRSYRRSSPGSEPIREEVVIRRRRHSHSPPGSPEKDKISRTTRRGSHRYEDDYENDGTTYVTDLWPLSDVGSDSEYSFTLVDEDDEKRNRSRDRLLSSINGDDDDGSKDSQMATNASLNYSEIKVFPTKYGPGSEYVNNVATSIIVDEDSVSPHDGKPNIETAAAKRSSVSGGTVLFRWLHLKQEHLNFNAFKRFVLETGGTSNNLRKELVELLEYVENQITPVETEKGKGRQMDPFVKCSFETARRRVSPSNILLWLCFPYFSLDRYQPRELPNGSLDHPARTLMQIYDSNQSKSRDLQQAVTKYDASNADKCLHVSQLWCLVINQSLIVTCGRLDIEQVRGKFLNLIPAPYPFPDTLRKKTNDSSPYIYVHDGGNCIYLFPVDRCQTWVEFTSQFAELGDSDSFQVFEGKTLVNSSNWTDLGITQRAWLAPVQLTLRPIRPTARLEPKVIIAQQGSSMSPDSSDNESLGDPGETSAEEKDQTRLPTGESLNVPGDPHMPQETIDKKSDGQRRSRDVHNLPQISVELAREKRDVKASPVKDKQLPESGSKADTPSTKVIDDLPQLDWTTDLRTFRVFTWLCAISRLGKGGTAQSKSAESPDSSLGGFRVDEDKLATNLKKVHAFLWSNKRPHERSAYKKCRQKSYAEFRKEFEGNLERFKKQSRQESRSSTRASRSPGSHRKDLFGNKHTRRKHARSFADAAKMLFQYFLPLQHKSSVGHKFWGGVNRITWQILFEQDEGNISARVAQFEELAKVAAEMSEHLSDGRAPPPDRLEISSHLYQAFMSAVIFVAGFQPKESHTYQYHRYLKECTSRINKGMTQLVNHFCTADLSEQEAVLPVGIMALVIRSVHQDITYSQPDLLYRAYKEYLNRLEECIRTDPKNRNYQVKIIHVKQELSVILGVLSEQERLLGDVRRALGPEGTGQSRSLLESPEGRAISIFYRTSSAANTKLIDFRGLARRVDDIFNDHQLLIQANKDNQEAASLTFAIVSVIFLPLTTVASILGMNTAEVRNMDQTQWVFWVTGLPLALLTGIFCLWATSQLDEVKTWIKRRLVHAELKLPRWRARRKGRYYGEDSHFRSDYSSTSNSSSLFLRRRRNVRDRDGRILR